LEFIRQQFPTHDADRAWSNFEFIADDGSINEVDLLVFTPQGLFLIEIKSRPGRVSGDSGTWMWETEGRTVFIDNPVYAANTKAKKLKSLLQRQKAARHREALPFLEALVFLSAPDLDCQVSATGMHRVGLRDGIMA